MALYLLLLLLLLLLLIILLLLLTNLSFSRHAMNAYNYIKMAATTIMKKKHILNYEGTK